MDPAKIKALLDAIAADDPEAIKAAAMDLLSALAGGESPPAPVEDPLSTMADPPKPEEAVAALTALRTLSGQSNMGEAIAFVTKLKADADATLAQAKALDESSRLVLVGDLVKLGAETPATAWADADKKIPASRLLAEPIAELRSRVVALRAARGEPAPKPQPPTRTTPEPAVHSGSLVVALSDGQKVTISASEIATCKKRNISNEDFAARKAAAVRRI